VLALCTADAVSIAQDGDRETAVQRNVQAAYERRGNRPLWVDAQGRPTLVAWNVVSRLRAAGEDGLAEDDYQGADLEYEAGALASEGRPAQSDAAGFDAHLTASAVRYFRDLHLGRVNPRELGFHLDHASDPHDFAAEVESVVSGRPLGAVVAGLRPPFIQYQRFRQMLGSYREGDPERARQIELAMERLRWLPDLQGEPLLVVNIPMFRVWGWGVERSDGTPSIEMSVITGRARATRTPVFTSRVTTMVLNPDWQVPNSIVRKEILPALDKDPNYLIRNHMTMTGDGRALRVRQSPGPWNALGQIKFVLPNVHSVFLHGTPAQELFKRDRRDFSHGCVRVEDPLALAEWILGQDSEWTAERLLAAIREGKTHTIAVARQPRIVVFYMTAAFVPDEGVIRFVEDVYGHDARLDAWLKAGKVRHP